MGKVTRYSRCFSTHILTRRMTTLTREQYLAENFSTHILTRRMTNSIEIDKTENLFNSHPHKEDDECNGCNWFCIDFSTHILTRRMTLWEKLQGTVDAFQLTSSQGG